MPGSVASSVRITWELVRNQILGSYTRSDSTKTLRVGLNSLHCNSHRGGSDPKLKFRPPALAVHKTN